MLLPNNKQKTKLFEYANASRFAYNWTLEKQQKNYKNGGKFIQDGELRKEFTKLKNINEYSWLCKISNNVTKQAIKDACNAYMRFYRKQSGLPKFKSKKKSKLSFYQDVVRIKFSNTHVKLEKLANNKKNNRQKLNWIRLAEHNKISENCKYVNPRITFDGINWWVSVSVNKEQSQNSPKNDGVGIDLGINNLAICSDKFIYKNINKSNKIKKLEKRIKHLQRKICKKYELNKKDNIYKKTNNIKKLQKELLILYRRLTNIRHNYLHQITTEIINREPIFIVLEDLSVRDMMKNKYLAKEIQQQCFYEFYRQIQYKCNWNNIKFIEADRYFPSSKTCSECGSIKKDLKLSDREYVCTECGCVIDRDYNASVNLMKYGQLIINH